VGHDRRAEFLAAEIAARQHGVISGVQARWAGVSARTLSRWVARGRIFRIGWNAYAYVPQVDDLGLLVAALLSAGADRSLVHAPSPDGTALDVGRATSLDSSVVLSHWSALRLQQVATGPVLPADVTVIGRGTRPRAGGVRGHRCQRLHPSDVRVVRGLPTTTVGRALIDVAADTPGRRLVRLIREAQFLGELPASELAAACSRAPRHPGVAALRAADPDLLVRLEGDSPLAGELGVFLNHETALGPWAAQHPIVASGHAFVLDHARADLALAVEADGAGAHEQSQGRTADARRDAVLLANGWATVRVTRTRLTLERDDLRETLHVIASGRGWQGVHQGWRPRSPARGRRSR
jgi:hypothetical protein